MWKNVKRERPKCWIKRGKIAKESGKFGGKLKENSMGVRK